MTRFRSIVLALILGALTLSARPAQAAQILPASPWYAVVHQPETDTLHWMNAGGQQASMPRPTLPNEVSHLGLRISPDGRTMVMAGVLSNGLQGLGIYDFDAGVFTQTHQAQPGETIELGGETVFTANSQYFAAGFYAGDFANPAWRVILFESATGNATAFIDQTHPNAPAVQLSAPAVQHIDASAVHFQMIPQAVGAAATWPAFAWRAFNADPAAPVVVESPYTRANAQVQLLSGAVVSSYTDNDFPVAPQDGQTPNLNAVGWQSPLIASPLTTVHADGARFHLSTRWAKGGEWILFRSMAPQQGSHWNIVLATGTPDDNAHVPFDPQFTEVYGTSDGYLLRNNANTLFYTNGFMPNTAMTVALLSPASEVVYVTPMGVNFALAQLPETGQPIITETPPVGATETPPTEPPAPVDCSTAPAQRVGIGSGARVLPSMGGLNLRQNPNGAIILTLGGGDTFDVTGGPICDGGLYWWQVNRFGTVGWLAEGTSDGYFIEPFVAPPPAEETPVTVTPDPVTPETVTPPPPPPSGGADDFLDPGAGEDDSLHCGASPSQELELGDSAIITGDNQIPRDRPNGNQLPYMLPQGMSVSVIGGPECAGTLRWWMVVGQSVPLAGNVQPSTGPFWVTDGSPSSRALRPR